MIKNALIQSTIHTESDIRQINNIYLQNINWEHVIPILMILLGHVINKSSHDVLFTTDPDEPFTTETLNKCIALTKEFVENENKLYGESVIIDTYTPNPLIDVVDENDAYISIDWCIENGKISLSKTMVKGVESLFERKYITDAKDYETVVRNIQNEMPITDPICRAKELLIDKTDMAIDNIDIKSLRSIYDKYLSMPRTDTFHNWLYSPKSKVIINITAITSKDS